MVDTLSFSSSATREGDCTVGNNRLDEEDIDGDNVLNLTTAERNSEQLRRYVINMADSSSYSRIGVCGTSPKTVVGPAPQQVCWVLFRVPFQSPSDSIGTPLLRRMRALRVTMISGQGAADGEFTQVPIARLQLTGARGSSAAKQVFAVSRPSRQGQAS
jgi:hypothetical protein